MEKLLEVKGVCVKYPGFRLSDISFACKPGEIIGLIGANGAGKSTTIKAIMHMIKRDAGEIYWKGQALTPKMIPDFREEVGYVGDSDCYYPNIKVKKILKIVSGLYRNWDTALIQTYLKKFDIDVNKKMKELSTGMRVKLDLLIAMSHHADIYILDEPTSGLDPIIRAEVLKILHHLSSEENKAVIISSHITSDLEKIAKRVVYIVDGEIVLNSEIEDIQKRFAKADTKGKESTSGIKGCLLNGNYIIAEREAFESMIQMKEMRLEKVTLEDLLFYLGGFHESLEID